MLHADFSALTIKTIEPGLLDLRDNSDSDLLLEDEFAEPLAVDQIYGRRGNGRGFSGRLREPAERHENSALSSGSRSVTLKEGDDIPPERRGRVMTLRLDRDP